MLEVKVWGDWACFTRPENKAERVSYDVMTPSAARGVLEAIFWKPEFRWQVCEIWALKPIRHFSIVRNEVGNVASVRAAHGWQDNDGHYYADTDRTQRHSLLLKDVSYLIRAEIVLAPHATDPVFKYRDQFRRRVQRGQCHHMPYLGTREFSASFSPAEGNEIPIPITGDLGRVLFDISYAKEKGGPVLFAQHDAAGTNWVEGRARPRFFPARLDNGILRIPQSLYEEVN